MLLLLLLLLLGRVLLPGVHHAAELDVVEFAVAGLVELVEGRLDLLLGQVLADLLKFGLRDVAVAVLVHGPGIQKC